MAKTNRDLILLWNVLLAIIFLALFENVIAATIFNRSRLASPVRISAVMQPPFISFATKTGDSRHSPENDSNGNFEGFCKDLLQQILVERHNLSYTIEPADAHGRQYFASPDDVSAEQAKQPNLHEQWTGVIGALINREADIGTGDLRVTVQRARVVDFTVPILTGHLVAVAPRNPQRHTHAWATMRSMTDFGKQNAINYGMIRGGSTAKTFENNPRAAYQEMWRHMNTGQGTSFARNATEGIRRVLQGAGDYAFIMESIAAEYEANLRPCELRIIEPDVDDSSNTNILYAMATQKSTPLLELLNRELLNLTKTGYVQQRFEHWWRKDEAEQNRNRCPSSVTGAADTVDGAGWRAINATHTEKSAGNASLPSCFRILTIFAVLFLIFRERFFNVFV